MENICEKKRRINQLLSDLPSLPILHQLAQPAPLFDFHKAIDISLHEVWRPIPIADTVTKPNVDITSSLWLVPPQIELQFQYHKNYSCTGRHLRRTGTSSYRFHLRLGPPLSRIDRPALSQMSLWRKQQVFKVLTSLTQLNSPFVQTPKELWQHMKLKGTVRAKLLSKYLLIPQKLSHCQRGGRRAHVLKSPACAANHDTSLHVSPIPNTRFILTNPSVFHLK